MRARRDLRFRGIDAPEIKTPEGKKAREFVVKELKDLDHVILYSSWADKFGRYVADIYYGEKDEKFLNQKLLDEGLAERYE